MGDYLSDSIYACSHKKCKLIKKISQQIDMAHQIPEFNRPLAAARNRHNAKLLKCFCSPLAISWMIFLSIEMCRTYIRYRCSMYGGRKCYFPFELVPEWLIDDYSNYVVY